MRTLALSMMYALCAYSVVQTIDPMWLDALVFLPLLILGTESLIRKKKVVLYIISLSLIFISNYYMGYMCGILHSFISVIITTRSVPKYIRVKKIFPYCRF